MYELHRIASHALMMDGDSTAEEPDSEDVQEAQATSKTQPPAEHLIAETV